MDAAFGNWFVLMSRIISESGFIGFERRQLKSCLRGVIVAFGLGEFHWDHGRGN